MPQRSLRERVGRLIAGRAATPAIDFHPQLGRHFGQGLGHQPATDTLLRESIGFNEMAGRAIANRVATLDPLVYTTRRVMGGTSEDEILDDHILKGLLDRPHPNFSRMQLLRLTAQHILATGKAYWLKVGNRLGVPAELHPMPPGRVWPVIRGGVVIGYSVLTQSGQTEELPPDVVVRFFFPDPEDPWEGKGYLSPVGMAADSAKFSGQHLRAHYQNDATPKTVLEAGETAEPFSEEERRRFFSGWRARYHSRQGDEQGMPGILPTGYKLVQMAMQNGVDIVPLLEFWRDEQLMGYGTPRSVLGQVVSGDRSSAETNQFVFDLHTVKPIADLIQDALTLQLAPDFDASIFVQFDEFVASDKAFDLAQEQSDLLNKVRSINQVRVGRGEDEVEWGDLPVGKLGDTPYTGEERENPFDDLEAFGGGSPFGDDEDEDEEEEEEEERMRMRVSPEVRAAWVRQVRREKKFVPALTRELRSILRDQRASVLAELEKQRAGRIRIEVDPLFDVAAWVRIFEVKTGPLRRRAFTEALVEALRQVGMDDAEFGITDGMLETLRRQGADMIKFVNRTTKAAINGAVMAGVEEGEGVDQIAGRIREVFSTRRKHARTIARTETLKASQVAQVTGYQLAGVVQRKRWNTSLDSSVRDSHAVANGQVVALSDSFTLGDGERADAPGVGVDGGYLSAGNTINCRCFVTPVLSQE